MKSKQFISLILVIAFCFASCTAKKNISKGGCYHFSIEQAEEPGAP